MLIPTYFFAKLTLFSINKALPVIWGVSKLNSVKPERGRSQELPFSSRPGGTSPRQVGVAGIAIFSRGIVTPKRDIDRSFPK